MSKRNSADPLVSKKQGSTAFLEQSIDKPELTLNTTQELKTRGILRIGDLVAQLTDGTEQLALTKTTAIEVCEVLAARGF